MSATSFDGALALVLEAEGGFVNDPRDPGGATKFGITRATLAAARGRPVSVAAVRALTRAEAGVIYRRLYWNAIRADDLPAGLDLACFDYAVNSGSGRSVRALQRVLGVATDGIVGPKTVAAARACDLPQTIRAMTRERVRFLQGLSTWPTFGRGWTSRVNHTEGAALALAATIPPAPGDAGTAVPSPNPQQPTESVMNASKSLFTSRTVWSNLIGLASLGLGLFGIETGTIDPNGLADAASQVIAGASFIASTVFRVVATKQIKPAT
jgi:lysozyme family protein